MCKGSRQPTEALFFFFIKEKAMRANVSQLKDRTDRGVRESQRQNSQQYGPVLVTGWPWRCFLKFLLGAIWRHLMVVVPAVVLSSFCHMH